jgi:hypothetical protein
MLRPRVRRSSFANLARVSFAVFLLANLLGGLFMGLFSRPLPLEPQPHPILQPRVSLAVPAPTREASAGLQPPLAVPEPQASVSTSKPLSTTSPVRQLAVAEEIVDLENSLHFGEPADAKRRRVEAWRAQVARMKLNLASKPNLILSDYDVFDVQGDVMIRSAIPLSDRCFVVQLHRPHLKRIMAGEAVSVLQAAWTKRCAVRGAHDNGTAQACTCQVLGLNDRIRCIASGAVPDARVLEWGDGLSVPVEPLLGTATSSKGVHVCVQGVAWTEPLYGRLPDELFETWVGHYARYGVTDIHIYTNATELAEPWSRGSRSPRRTRVWFHDSPLPRKHHSYSFLSLYEVRVRSTCSGTDPRSRAIAAWGTTRCSTL